MQPNRVERDAAPRSLEWARYALMACFCLLVLVAAHAYAAEAAPAGPSRPEATVDGTVAASLLPGATTGVRFAVENPSSRNLRVERIVLTKVEVDRDHASCAASVSEGGAAFAMPPVEVHRSFPPGRTRLATRGRLTMIETGLAQNTCRGATLTLTLETR